MMTNFNLPLDANLVSSIVIHPASLFHITELNLSNSDLIALVTNNKVVDSVRNYEKL